MSAAPDSNALLDAAIRSFRRVKIGREDAATAIPKIRDYLKAAGLDASAINIAGSRTADEMEAELERLREAARQHGDASNARSVLR